MDVAVQAYAPHAEYFGNAADGDCREIGAVGYPHGGAHDLGSDSDTGGRFSTGSGRSPSARLH